MKVCPPEDTVKKESTNRLICFCSGKDNKVYYNFIIYSGNKRLPKLKRPRQPSINPLIINFLSINSIPESQGKAIDYGHVVGGNIDAAGRGEQKMIA